MGIAELASTLGARTDFHLLNATSQGQCLSIGAECSDPSAPAADRRRRLRYRLIVAAGQDVLALKGALALLLSGEWARPCWQWQH